MIQLQNRNIIWCIIRAWSLWGWISINGIILHHHTCIIGDAIDGYSSPETPYQRDPSYNNDILHHIQAQHASSQLISPVLSCIHVHIPHIIISSFTITSCTIQSHKFIEQHQQRHKIHPWWFGMQFPIHKLQIHPYHP